MFPTTLLNNITSLIYMFQVIYLRASRSSFRVNNTTSNNSSSSSRNYSLADRLTVVTGYFNLGSFQKDSRRNFTNAIYRQWMSVFASIYNPVVVFGDTDSDLEFFAKVRSCLPSNLTKLTKVRRNETWAFSLEDRISKIYKQPGYPQHHPNTVNPGYSVCMHAKYELMAIAIRDNPFKTKYFCWLDIGFFRDLTLKRSINNPAIPFTPLFRLGLPFNFSTNSVAYTQLRPRNSNLTLRQIIYNNKVWLCGGYFVGEGSIFLRWTEEYRRATMLMLDSNLMSSDQQVLYYMFNALKPKTKIQTYIFDNTSSYDWLHLVGNSSYKWFHLGYISRYVL